MSFFSVLHDLQAIITIRRQIVDKMDPSDANEVDVPDICEDDSGNSVHFVEPRVCGMPTQRGKGGFVYGSNSNSSWGENNAEPHQKMQRSMSEEADLSKNLHYQGDSLNARSRLECEQWKERGRQSNIFGEATGTGTGDEARGKSAARNWPWQEQSVNSSVFENGSQTPAGASDSTDDGAAPDSKKWPWQQKALSSDIFREASPQGQANQEAPTQKRLQDGKGKKHYEWNQTKCTHDFGGDYGADDRFQRGPNLGISNSKAKSLKKAGLSGRSAD